MLVSVALGVVGAIALARTITSFSCRSEPYDLQTLLTTALVLIVVTLAAALGPAPRAVRINPIETFK